MNELKPWALPLIVVGLLAPLALGLALFGPQGMVFAAVIVAIALVIIVSRPRRDRPIEVAPGDGRHHVLIVAAEPIDSPRLAERIVAGIEREAGEREGGGEVLVVSPAINPTLDHWAADVADARARASARLDATLDRLKRSGLDARGSVGDSNPMLAIEDALRDFPADEVLVIAGEEMAAKLASELRDRLDRPVEAVALAPGGG